MQVEAELEQAELERTALLKPRNDIRNIAIVAHVDHGKTTLVDGMLKQTHVFRNNQQVQERVLDSNDLERERGITILAKNTGVVYNGTTINIVDTPGHADFGGEVERTVNMVDGVLLLVDAVEGPMAQTRFVLRQALQRGLQAIVVVNKVDRPSSRVDYVVNSTFDLFLDLGATDAQADFPVVYTIALTAQAGYAPDKLEKDLAPLFDTIIRHIPPPLVNLDGPTQMLVTTLDYSNYVGKIAIGRLTSGKLRTGQRIMHMAADGTRTPGKVAQVFSFRNLQRVPEDEVTAGNIVAISGIDAVSIGDTIADIDNPIQLPPITVEEPTVRMTFAVNDSPFAGRSGQFLTSRQLRSRLMQELERNVALRVLDTSSASEWTVSGRGELHLAILIETMRREGYEFSVSQPEVINKIGPNGETLEPWEEIFVEAHSDYWGGVSEMLGRRRARMTNIRYGEDGTVYGEFLAPTRGMLGLRQPMLSATRGTGIFHTLFHGYEMMAGDIDTNENGSLIALETGSVTAYSLVKLAQRGDFIIKPGDEVYGGQVIGKNNRTEDMVINIVLAKQLTNFREKPSATTDALIAARDLSLDDTIQYLGTGDLMEVTPDSLRIRKKILNHDIRQRMSKKAKTE